MINGAHVVLHGRTRRPTEPSSANVLAFPDVDAGGGWLTFELPPAEIAVHPTEGSGP